MISIIYSYLKLAVKTLKRTFDFTDQKSSEMYSDEEQKERPPCPRENANPLSAVTFFYSLKVFHKGRKTELTEDDLSKPLPEHKSSYLGEKISRIWSDEYDYALEHKKRPRMGRVIVRTFLPEFFIYGVIIFCMEIPIRLFQPIFVGLFIKYFNEANRNSTEDYREPMFFNRVMNFWAPNQGRISKEEAYFFATGITVVNCIVVMVTHPFMLAVLHVGMKVRVACCSLIYRKVLRLKFTSLGGRTVGNVVNLMSNDVNRFDLAAMFVHYIWISPLQLCCIIYFMYREVQWSALVGVIAIIIVMPLQLLFGVRSATLRKYAGARTDERVRQMNEIIQSIQVIKMYAWENAFAELIKHLRKKELKILIQTSYIRGLIMSFIMFTTRSAIFLTVMSFIFLGNNITADKTFMIISYYQILRQTMTVYFPQGVAMIAEAMVSVERIEEFMVTEETTIGDPSPLDENWQKKLRHLKDRKFNNFYGRQASVHVSHGIAKYGDVVCLDDINFRLTAGTLFAIVGPVGAGKSCILQMVMGELPLYSGRIVVNGVVSYAAQEAWLFAGSVRQNILFGREFNYQRYRDVVKVCALTRDFSMLPFGDRTIVGERGISLSGGQRARVNLARCVYKEADIYLLDDPLSAVDIHVGQQLFEGCIKRYLKDKIVILITHQLQYLKRADHIVIMNEGVVQCQGPYMDLIGQDDIPQFAHILKEISTTTPVEEKEVEKLLKGISVTSAVFNSMIDIEGRKTRPLVVPEMRTVGAVEFTNYTEYFKAGANGCGIFCMVFLFLFAQFVASFGDYFLAQWVNVEELRMHRGSAEAMTFFNRFSRNDFIIIYNVLIVGTIVIAILRSIVYYTICMRASQRLHNRMFESVIHAVLLFFNLNTSGRILNRFSKDLGQVDELLPNAFCDTTQLLLSLVGAVLVVAIVDYYLLIPIFMVMITFFFLRDIYLRTSRNVKRLEGINQYGSGVGLSITQCIGLSGLVQWGMRQSAELENQMTSVERVLEFTKIQHEPPLESTPDNKPPANWPKYGKIEFVDTTMKYSLFEPPVLKNLNILVKPREKIGIVGRTGAGKSSLINTLFRLTNYDGLILIDNLDISVMGLHDLRKKISIIPQEPVLFSGTLRYNLDPFNEYTDEQIFASLLAVEIKNAMQSGIECLDDIMTEGGTNISVGSRQMVCLARAILRNNRILVLDEATANVDAQTDRFIQTTIRTKFAHCTVLTIAHRLNTVMDSDKLLVMDGGRMIEYDHPHVLIQNNGLLAEMVKKTGPGISDRLKIIAKENFQMRQQFEMRNIVNDVVRQALDVVSTIDYFND
ncbi:probable multidrug resistance-associated protein lethal(2)03659 isoform X2 [Diorhabda carinulata]|uniref:probable multidrug resistance-associated protein lethal(2)03659 isoform X2 n=1 Tax=Diorhabda carinulata TaxID=1163345 RepID=UPI0025A01580|nr:probable multidrug resistance-associated protein lethal(2)03659 isoform X2 [Diorhabda carinulata]